MLYPAETVIQEEESQWAEDNQQQQRNATALYIDDPYNDIRNMYVSLFMIYFRIDDKEFILLNLEVPLTYK